MIACTLVQKFDDHLVIDTVVPDQELQVLRFKAAHLNRTSEWSKRRKSRAKSIPEMVVRGVPDEVVRVQEGGVANGASDLLKTTLE